MGLAEPRKRIKISHDPRNLSWSQQSSSYGQRLMQQQGWREGQSLGARGPKYAPTDDASRLAAAKVGVLVKDDTLGLGAKHRKDDVEGQRTGLDAFAGLLGRLNGKSDSEVKQVEKKAEDRKLAMYAQGRWGGMIFVPGGVLIQGDEFKKAELKQQNVEDDEGRQEAEPDLDEVADDRARRKAERKKRREERRLHREEKKAKKAAKAAAQNTPGDDRTKGASSPVSKSSKAPVMQTQAPDEPTSSTEEELAAPTEPATSTTKRGRSSVTVTEVKTTQVMRNGRHLLRGRNIQAKRMAFSDTKGLDEIFMRKS